MALNPNSVDVLLSTLDQQAPTTARPLGRLSRLINAVVRRYMNPRAADGTVTHVKVEKRDAFVTTTGAVVDGTGASAGNLSGTPHLLFGGGDALREVAGNRLFTKSGAAWVRATDSTGDTAIVFPHVVRSQSVYAANSQAEAPDIAAVGDVTCLVWREIANQSTANGTLAPGATTVSGFDGVRVMLRNANGTTVRAPFALNPNGGATVYLKVRVYAYGGRFFVLQDFITSGSTVHVCVTVFDTAGVQLATTTLATVANNQHWDAVIINGEGVVLAEPANGAGVKFTAIAYSSGITTSTNTEAGIGTGGTSFCAWLVDQTQTVNTGYVVVGSAISGATQFVTPYKIVSLARNHTYPDVTSFDTSTLWMSGVCGFKDPNSTSLVVAYTLMDLFGLPEWTAYGGTHTSTDSFQNSQASDQYPDQLNNVTVTKTVPFTGSATTIQTRYAMSLASRAFSLNGDYVAWGYYPARKWAPLSAANATPATHAPNRPADPSNFQQCWYLLPLASKQRIAGRLEYGLAAADYQVLAPNTGSAHPATAATPGYRNRCLVSVVTTSSGALMLPLGYRAEQNIPSAALLTQQVTANGQTSATVFSYSSTSMVYSSSSTIGVKVFTFGPDYGQAFAVNQATYLPGLMASVVEPGDVNVSEHGIAAPECPNIITGNNVESSQPAGLTGGAIYTRAVAEYVTTRGKVYRSLPSAAFAFTSVEQYDSDICGHFVNPTNKAGVRYSIYRTAYLAAQVAGASQTTSPPSVPSASAVNVFTSVAYKITNDLAPFYNQPDVARFGDSLIFPGVGVGPFQDVLTPETMGVGEVLYTDQGFLPRFPAPAFRGGCVWRDRAWLIGYDNALWFSGEIAEGEGEWFNPAFRVVIPTNEEITAVASLDEFLLVFCQRSIWYIPSGAQLPDATGANGTIPTATRLPFEMGSAGGFTSVIRQGCVYDSSNGGAWMITRSLDNVWIGQDARDDLSPGITGMCVAGNYVVCATDTGALWNLLAYDTNLGGWSTWAMQADGSAGAALVTAFDGLLAWADDGRVWLQAPGSYFDVDNMTPFAPFYVSMDVTVAPVHIGGVRSWKRTWEIQAEGTVEDACALTVGLCYDDSGIITDTRAPKDVTTGLLELPVRPLKQLAASTGIQVSDGPNASTSSGQGFTLEALGFYVGLEKGLKKLPPSSRV